MKEIGYQVFGIGLALFGIGIALPNTIQTLREMSKKKNKADKYPLIISIVLMGIGIVAAVVGFAGIATG